MPTCKEAQDAILEILQNAHRTMFLSNWLDGDFADQRPASDPTGKDGVYGHAYQIVKRIRESGLVRPGGLELPFDWHDCEDWDAVDACIWDNAMSEPSLDDLRQLYLFDAEEVIETWG